MENSNSRAGSPVRSKSIKIKVPSKKFPQDFFRRSSSNSPNKLNPNRYIKESPPKNSRPDLSNKNEIYWEVMREELEKQKPTKKGEKNPNTQRIWVYSEKKNRGRQTPLPKSQRKDSAITDAT